MQLLVASGPHHQYKDLHSCRCVTLFQSHVGGVLTVAIAMQEMDVSAEDNQTAMYACSLLAHVHIVTAATHYSLLLLRSSG